jgi:5-formyltetrahydrofolate cyclo-ligase
MEEKDLLRKKLRLLRDGIPAALREEKSRTIAARLSAVPWYAGTSCFFVYAAIRSEVDLRAFYERALADGKALFFPKVDGKNMDFYRVDDCALLKRGAFGVPEPDPAVCPRATAQEERCAVLLAPGVAFSVDGFRIGYGGGFYDRYLERKSELYPVGICFGEQLLQAFVPQAHDRRMREIITENQRLEM